MPVNTEVIHLLTELGGTVVVVVFALFLFYKLLSRFGVPFVQSQQNIATAVSRQAVVMDKMSGAVHEFINRDSSEHREILLGLQVVGKELKTLVNEIARLKNDGRKSHEAQPDTTADIRSVGTRLS